MFFYFELFINIITDRCSSHENEKKNCFSGIYTSKLFDLNKVFLRKQYTEVFPYLVFVILCLSQKKIHSNYSAILKCYYTIKMLNFNDFLNLAFNSRYLLGMFLSPYR